MFLIYNEEEHSLSRVDKEAVVCEVSSMKVDDKVNFVWNGKLHKGVVRLISGHIIMS